MRRQFYRLFARKKLKLGSPSPGFTAMTTVNLPPFISGPIDAGLCLYGDIKSLDIDDFANMNEILAVRQENQRRSEKAAKAG